MSPLSPGAQQELLRGCGGPWGHAEWEQKYDGRARWMGTPSPQSKALRLWGLLWGAGADPLLPLLRLGVMGGSQGAPVP